METLNERSNSPSSWIRGAVWGLGLVVAVSSGLVATLWSDVDSKSLERNQRLSARVDDISARKHIIAAKLDGVARRLAALDEHVKSHDSEAEDWKKRIERNAVGIHDVQNNATARRDSFTGTQGAEHERRIDRLELNGVVMVQMGKRLDRLEQEVSDGMAYYRQQILPLIQQSNTLQQQRIQQGMK